MVYSYLPFCDFIYQQFSFTWRKLHSFKLAWAQRNGYSTFFNWVQYFVSTNQAIWHKKLCPRNNTLDDHVYCFTYNNLIWNNITLNDY